MVFYSRSFLSELTLTFAIDRSFHSGFSNRFHFFVLWAQKSSPCGYLIGRQWRWVLDRCIYLRTGLTGTVTCTTGANPCVGLIATVLFFLRTPMIIISNRRLGRSHSCSPFILEIEKWLSFIRWNLKFSGRVLWKPIWFAPLPPPKVKVSLSSMLTYLIWAVYFLHLGITPH